MSLKPGERSSGKRSTPTATASTVEAITPGEGVANDLPIRRRSDKASKLAEAGAAKQAATSRRRNRPALPAVPSNTDRPTQPQIQIDIDPVITAGYIQDRYDVLIRGRAVSDVPVEEAALLLDGVMVGRVQFGEMDSTAPDSLPGGDNGTQYVFHFHLPLRREQAHRICACVIAVHTRNNEAYEESFNLLVEPANLIPVSVASGPTCSSSIYDQVRPPILLYVERAALDDSGQLLVHGWAVSLTAMVTVQVSIAEERIGAAQLGGRREDVGDAYPAYPNARVSGFVLSVRIAIPTERMSGVRVQALSLNGFSHEVVLPVERVNSLSLVQPAKVPPQTSGPPAQALPQQQPTSVLVEGAQLGPDARSLLATQIPSSSVPPSGRSPQEEIHVFCEEMVLDARGHLSVVGWAVCAAGIATITILLDGHAMGEAELGMPRDDVGDEYRHIPMARHSGFRFAKALGNVPAGEHHIRVLVRNRLDDIREETRAVLVKRDKSPARRLASQFRLAIDNPPVAAGVVAEPITGRLTIEGWALARSGIVSIEVLLDDQRIGEAHYGQERKDVSTAFPDWKDSLHSGYVFYCPPRGLRNGDQVVQLNIRAKSGEVLKYRFRILVRKSEEFEAGISIRRRITQVEARVSEDVLDNLGHRPGFRLVMCQGRTQQFEALCATLNSLRTQVYRDWRLEILATDVETGAGVRAVIAEAANDLGERIDVFDPSDEIAFDRPIGSLGAQTTLRLVGFLSAGDQFGCDALLQIALASGLHCDADLIYADEVRFSPGSREREPFFKPDYSPDLLLSMNYIGRPWFASAALLARCGVTARDLLKAGEYDTVLRCTEQAVRIHHVPNVLCQRGAQQIDEPEKEAVALTRAAARRGIAADVVVGAAPGTWRLKRTQPVTGLVSIIIQTCAARKYVETCIKTLRERTAYRSFEIICVDDSSGDQSEWASWLKLNADRVVSMPVAFNWSNFNNRGAEVASGEYLLFLSDAIEVTQPDWLDAMLEHVQRPEVAIVGPQLRYPDNKVQHAGIFLASPGMARNAFRFTAADEPGYFGLALTQRNVIAVTGACMLMRRSIYQALGGFEEAREIDNCDLDFCLRAHESGKLSVFTPYASLIHHEAVSYDPPPNLSRLGHFRGRWKTLFAAGDPYFSPRLLPDFDDYRPDDEPVEAVFAGHPLFRQDEIKRILVVKVDHIGDFITAIPAIRRLKQIFPSAAIHVLACRAARAVAEIEDCIDEFIEFEFFHAISGLGQKQISKQEYQSLRERLAPYRFDIAVDLRKHPDTREVLRYTPARFFAGYDYLGQFSFLDIALEWEGDKNLVRKRGHIMDDLINLVEAVGTACAPDSPQLDFVAPSKGLPAFLTDDARALFVKPVIIVHPGVGNVMRQWPAEHFASLIDLLVEKNAVNAILIGGPEETKLAEEVLGHVINREAVVSLVGRTSLQQLIALLNACALYVGNNSGPKHIAAGLGVPTIGIHSGVVDAIEWGPIGKRAVALRRNMTCSPCYLAQQKDCPRDFACMRGLEPIMVHKVSEIFLARPIEPRFGEPLVELALPVLVVNAQRKGRQSREDVGGAAVAKQPELGRKPKRNRRRRASSASVQ